MDIFYGFYDTQKERLICKGVTSIKQNAMYICQRIHVYQENGVLLMATGSVSPDCHHAVLEMDEHISLSQSQANSNLVFDFFSSGMRSPMVSRPHVTAQRILWHGMRWTMYRS